MRPTTSEQADLTRYLLQVTSFFEPPQAPLERFILDCGTDFPVAKRPKGVRKMRDKYCFQNATQLCNLYEDLSYAEGFAIHRGLIPMFHAWCISFDGTVIDPTWRYPERSVYRGYIIPREILLRSLVKHKCYGVLDYGMVDVELIKELREQSKYMGKEEYQNLQAFVTGEPQSQFIGEPTKQLK